MKKDLDRIKKLYGEDFAKKFCRPYFSHILEKEDFSFADFLVKLVAPSRYFYEDLIQNNKLESFKNSIWGMFSQDSDEYSNANETPEQLMKKVGYALYKCETSNDIEKFRKYYASNEELCTFEDPQRINTHTIFWAVKDGVGQIRRENFPNPKRQDEYGTSVISIQFTKGFESTLSIKNRYNLLVEYGDATFSNDLENIQPGLTNSFKKYYGINLVKGRKAFELEGYIADEYGVYHKSNYKIKGVCYCADNIVIHNGKSTHYDPTRYILADYYIIDRKEKTIKLLDESEITDSFVDQFGRIKKIDSAILGEGKFVKVYCVDGGIVEIVLNKYNQITKLTNRGTKQLGDGFMRYCLAIEELILEDVEEIGDNCLSGNKILNKFLSPKLSTIGNVALYENLELKELVWNNVSKIGDLFLVSNKDLSLFVAPKLESAGLNFMRRNKKITTIDFPKLTSIDFGFMEDNDCATKFSAPLLSMKKNGVRLNSTLRQLKKDNLITKMIQTVSKFKSEDELWDMF